MKFLAIDTANEYLCVVAYNDGKTACAFLPNCTMRHSTQIMAQVEKALAECDLTLSECDFFAAVVGAGSFTGIRIGVSAAKGLAWAKELPCAAVSTLEAMAQNLAHMEDFVIVCAMDARRNQVYNALFHEQNGSLQRLCEDRAVALSVVAEDLKNEARKKIIVGDGAVLCYNYLTQSGISCTLAPESLRMQDAVGVCLCAHTAAQQELLISSAELQPVYLRLSQAERERLEKEHQTKGNE